MLYTLIIVFISTSWHTMTSQSIPDFKTEQACEDAGAAIAHPDMWGNSDIKTYCVPQPPRVSRF